MESTTETLDDLAPRTETIIVFRFYDWQCTACDEQAERLTNVPHGEPVPRQDVMECHACGQFCLHERLMSAPAEYMGEKVHNPMVSGGRFDTMGMRRLPKLPDIDGAKQHREAIERDMRALGPDYSKDMAQQVHDHHAKSAPTMEDYSYHFKTPEYVEAKRARRKARKENLEKQKRAKALRKGANINMRRDKCAGDPRI